MDTNRPDTTQDIKTSDAGPLSDSQHIDAPQRPRRKAVAVVAFIITVAAWIMLPVYYWVSAVLALAGLVSAIVATRQRRGAWRNLAQVSIVACATLLLVLIVFWSVLLYLLKA